MRRTPLEVGLAVVLGGCALEVLPVAEVSEDHGYDSVHVLRDAAEIRNELTASPEHRAGEPFARVSVLHRAQRMLRIEVSTSVDGVIWSAWDTGVLATDASDLEAGVFVFDVEVADGEARYFRIRGPEDPLPSELAVLTSSADDLVAEAELTSEELGDEPAEELELRSVPELEEELAFHSTFRRYRFDLGYVGRSWLWLLRTARRRGWGGSLYGPRTGLRTYAQQAALWRAYQNGTGAPAFPPWGPSRHLIRNVRPRGSWYQAVDTNDVGSLIRIARGLGVSLHTPYSREPWHVEARHRFGPPRGWRP